MGMNRVESKKPSGPFFFSLRSVRGGCRDSSYLLLPPSIYPPLAYFTQWFRGWSPLSSDSPHPSLPSPPSLYPPQSSDSVSLENSTHNGERFLLLLYFNTWSSFISLIYYLSSLVLVTSLIPTVPFSHQSIIDCRPKTSKRFLPRSTDPRLRVSYLTYHSLYRTPTVSFILSSFLQSTRSSSMHSIVESRDTLWPLRSARLCMEWNRISMRRYQF